MNFTTFQLSVVVVVVVVVRQVQPM